jgi:quercetin dioxygenase-like cupin family protein
MMEPELQQDERTGKTSQREEPHLAADLLTFDLAAELTQIKRMESWQRGDRTAKTLLKEPHLRLTLVALKAGALLDEHTTEGAVTIQGLTGLLRVTVAEETREILPNHLLTLQIGVPHKVEAIQESAFLLTVAMA